MNKKSPKINKFTLNTKGAVKWLWIIIAAPFALLFLLLLLTAIGVFGKLPTFEELENPKNNLATELYSEDGKVIGSFHVENRSYVDYTQLNDSLVAALVATEDIRYYSHSGIDFMSLARVALKSVAMGRREQGGGSTITQQLAKNLFPRDTVKNRSSINKNSRLVVSKLKEWITAVKLEHNYTKEEIIAMYLNTMGYSSNAYGIKSASHTYFNKEPADLTINEAAMLVGIVNAPTAYNPHLNPERALRRRNKVLDRMKEFGFINRKQLDSLSATPILLDYRPVSHNYGTATYFRAMLSDVMTRQKPSKNDRQYRITDADDLLQKRIKETNFRNDLREWEGNPLYGWVHKNLKPDGTQYNIYRDGLKIYTTINASMQQYAEEALWTRLANEIQPGMDAQYARSQQIFRNLTRSQQNEELLKIYRRERRGDPEADIKKDFEIAVPMKIFSYKGDVDTLMTPRDSIIHFKKIMRASFMAMDPTNGHIKAYVGGPDYRYFKYDMVKQGKRQVGSTIKPFIYTFGIDHLGLTPCSPVQNIQYVYETSTGELWEPKEAGGVERAHTGETRPLWWGLANSRNNFSVWIMRQSKNPEAVAEFINNMGVYSYIDPVPSLALGAAELSLFELLGAYSTFANGGVYTDPIFVMRIEDRYGNVISTFNHSTKDAIGEESAYTMLQMMKNVVNAGTAGRLRHTYGFTGEIAGKTGTGNDNRDAWFVGVTPKLVAGAWVGADDQRTSLNRQGEGSVVALPIFGEFMKRVYGDVRLGIGQDDKFIVPASAVIYNCPKDIYMGGDSVEIVDDDEFFD